MAAAREDRRSAEGVGSSIRPGGESAAENRHHRECVEHSREPCAGVGLGVGAGVGLGVGASVGEAAGALEQKMKSNWAFHTVCLYVSQNWARQSMTYR